MRFKSIFWVIAVTFSLALIFSQTASAGDNDLTYYYNLTPAGFYEVTAIYNVHPAEAFAAYANDRSSETGSGHLYRKFDADQMERIGSSENFHKFLDANYEQLPVYRGQACDDEVLADWVLTCPFDCSPPSNCYEWVHFTVTITCLDIPPCPDGEDCLPFAGRIFAFATDPVPVCYCDGGAGGTCTAHEGAEVTEFWSIGPVCECVPDTYGACLVGDECLVIDPDSCTVLGGSFQGAGTGCDQVVDDYKIPTLSEWGLIIFSLLILSLVTVVVARRRTSTAAAGGAGGSVTMSGPLFVPARFMKALTVTLGLAVVILVSALLISGSIPLRDIVGTILSAAIVAYIAHLWIVPKD